MTPHQARIISQAAHRQCDQDPPRTAVHICSPEVAALADAYLDGERVRAQIAVLARRVQYALSDHQLQEAGGLAVEIEGLAK